jgi:hypothetical protein
MKFAVGDWVRFKIFRDPKTYIGRVIRPDSKTLIFYRILHGSKTYLRKGIELEKLSDEEAMVFILENR